MPGVSINQDAWFHLADFDKDFHSVYNLKNKENGVYIFIIKGEVIIQGQQLGERDALGIWNINSVTVKAGAQGAEILLMEVPMSI